jgi:hypothetical protein
MSVDQQVRQQKRQALTPEQVDAYRAQYFPQAPVRLQRPGHVIQRQGQGGAVQGQPGQGGQQVQGQGQQGAVQGAQNAGVQQPPVVPNRPGTLPPQPNVVPTGANSVFRDAQKFLANPDSGWTTAKAKKTEAIRVEMEEIAKAELTGRDDVSRKVWKVFDSTDAQYKSNVSGLVKTTLTEIVPALTNPAKDPGAAIKTLNGALDKLAVERAHYADVRGINPKETELLDQRKRKVDAIDSHVAEFKKLNEKLRAVLKLRMEPALTLLSTFPALPNDPVGQQGIASFAQSLEQNEQLRQELFQAAGPEHCAALCKVLNIKDGWCQELAAARASDPEFMDPMCETAILAETGTAQKETIFRENAVASKLAVAYAQNSPAGKIYCEAAYQTYANLTKGKGALELNPAKMQGDEQAKQKMVNQNVAAHKKILGEMVDHLTQDPNSVPPEIAKICKTHYDEGLRVAKGNNAQATPEDEEFATTQAGSFLMLRLVNPVLTTKSEAAANKFYNDAKDKSGKKLTEFEKDMTPEFRQKYTQLQEQGTLARLQTKIMQNMANGVEYKAQGGKEPHMVPMNSVIKQNDQPAPETAKLRGFLKRIAGGQ